MIVVVPTSSLRELRLSKNGTHCQALQVIRTTAEFSARSRLGHASLGLVLDLQFRVEACACGSFQHSSSPRFFYTSNSFIPSHHHPPDFYQLSSTPSLIHLVGVCTTTFHHAARSFLQRALSTFEFIPILSSIRQEFTATQICPQGTQVRG